MSTAPSSAAPTSWMREHTRPLASLEADAPLDDLEPLREVIGDARVVAIGEGAHFVDEFSRVRQRVARFLAERCGFTVFAFEHGFPEAPELDDWVCGRTPGETLREVDPRTADWGGSYVLEWLRRHNLGSSHPLRFAGIDVPRAGSTLRPALEPLQRYLAAVDPDSAGFARTALEISEEFLAGLGSQASAAPAWSRLPAARQDALTAALTRLHLRLRSLRPLLVERGGEAEYDRAERLVAAACHTDYMFRAAHELFSGGGLSADTSVRDLYMAETVRWQLERAGEGARIVLAAHNNHIQKCSVEFDGVLTALPMGQQLARMLGEDYASIGVTHTGSTIPEMFPDEAVPLGFTLSEVELAEPQPGSVEAGLVQAGFGDRAALTDLRNAPTASDGSPLLTETRTQSATIRTPLPGAFDAVISTPTATKDPTVAF